MAKLFTNRFCQRVGNGPAILKTHTNGLIWYPCEFRPLYHGHSLPFPRKDSAVSSIPTLLFSVGPVAVFFEIAFFVVDAIQRVLRGGTWTQVFKERFKRIFPVGADKNITTAITAISMIFRIVAALVHTLPNTIFRTFAHVVCDKSKPIGLSNQTAAASCASGAQMITSNDHHVPAHTATPPSEGFGFPSYRFQRCQPSEFLIGEISRPHVGIIP